MAAVVCVVRGQRSAAVFVFSPRAGAVQRQRSRVKGRGGGVLSKDKMFKGGLEVASTQLTNGHQVCVASSRAGSTSVY